MVLYSEILIFLENLVKRVDNLSLLENIGINLRNIILVRSRHATFLLLVTRLGRSRGLPYTKQITYAIAKIFWTAAGLTWAAVENW